MKLYQLKDGTMVGFYREKGAEVEAVMYRDVYEQQLVTKTREVPVTVPGHWEVVEVTDPGYWKRELVVTPGHYEPQEKCWEEHTETRYRTVEAHYEIKPVWYPEETITKTRVIPGYWEPYERDIPPRGVYEETGPPYTWYRWIPEHEEEYEVVIPGYFKDQKVWVEATVEPYEVVIDAGCKTTYVWRESYGTWTDVWVEPVTRKEKVWVEEKTEYVTEEYKELEDVWVGREPVYSMVDPTEDRLFEVVSLNVEATGSWEMGDSITIRNIMTGEELTTQASYLGLANRISENEFAIAEAV